jgi:K+-sensing histidine kinase KdpD
VRRYLQAVIVVLGSVGIATLLTFPLARHIVHSRDLLLLSAVILTARWAGAVPGLCAALLSFAVFDWFFDQTPYTLDFTWGGLLRAGVFGAVSLLVATLERQRRQAIAGLENANRDLRAAFDEIKVLRGFLPICAQCKQIRAESGAWVPIERYVHEHSEASFTHSICPDCMRILYPEISSGDRRQDGRS